MDGREMEMTAAGGGGKRKRPCPARPVYQLSVKLIDTLQLINRRYYEEKGKRQQQKRALANEKGIRRGMHNNGYDDQNYDYICLEEEELASRYIVKESVGKGSFGKVYKAYDKHTGDYVAIKIIKSKRPFVIQAKVEIEILEHIMMNDPQGLYNCARLKHKFIHEHHQCLVFEMLSHNLYQLLQSTQFQGISLDLIRKFSRNILKALCFLAHPEVDVIHCDLKPENILLQHPRQSNIKVIDFGSSCRASQRVYSYIQSRFYRSPEVMLGLPYTCAIDMWSLGCILVELHTGEPLFAGTDQFDQMCRIVSVVGMIPDDVIERSPPQYWSLFFETHDELSPPRCQQDVSQSDGVNTDMGGDVEPQGAEEKDWRGDKTRDSKGGGWPPPPQYRSEGRYRLRQYLLKRRLKQAEQSSESGASPLVGEGVGGDSMGGHVQRIELRQQLARILLNRGQRNSGAVLQTPQDPHTVALFIDLIARIMEYRPENRISPSDALQHPFLRTGPSTTGMEQQQQQQQQQQLPNWHEGIGESASKSDAPSQQNRMRSRSMSASMA